jgi:hypothetical protein
VRSAVSDGDRDGQEQEGYSQVSSSHGALLRRAAASSCSGDQAGVMASDGQTSVQVAQSLHFSGSIW